MNILNELTNRSDYFLKLFSEHLLISFVSVFFVALVGIWIGIWVFYSSKSRAVIIPIINFLYTIPSIAMFGLLIPLVGIGLQNALIVLVLYGLMPIVRNTYTGFKEVPLQMIEAAQGLGSTPKQILYKIYLPLALPTILSGLRVTTVMLIALTGLSALIGAGGLGQAIFRGLNTMNTPLIVAGSLGISLFAILGDKFIGVLENNQNLLRLLTHNAVAKQKRQIYTNLTILIALLLSALIYINPFATSHEKTITVASKPTSEQFILGEIIAQLIENQTDIQIIRKFGIGGGTTNIHPAMLSKDLDIYVEYTGTSWMNVLKKDLPSDNKIDFTELNKLYKQKYQLEWLGLLGFNNTYALAISQQNARERKINTITDLAAQSKHFRFGAEFDFFERPDAYKGLLKHYPLTFKSLHEMDINLRYQAYAQGQVDAIDVFTTDAQIESQHLQILLDDKNFFPAYEAGIVVRSELMQQYPEIKKILQSLNGKISTDKMRQLNYQVEISHKTASQVAAEFINTHLYDQNQTQKR